MKKLPNIISILRILLLVPYALFFLYFDGKWPLFIIALLSIISDKLDGSLARTLKCESKTGALLDSIADVVFVFASWVFFYMKGLYGLEVFILLLVPRTIMGFGILIHWLRKRSWKLDHNIGNKIGAVFDFATILWLILQFPYANIILYTTIGINMLAAVLSAGIRNKKICT